MKRIAPALAALPVSSCATLRAAERAPPRLIADPAAMPAYARVKAARRLVSKGGTPE